MRVVVPGGPCEADIVSQEIPREVFSEEDYARFGDRLEESLEAMAAVLARPGFGVGPTTLGAELEVGPSSMRSVGRFP